jgi:hypothetical protein
MTGEEPPGVWLCGDEAKKFGSLYGDRNPNGIVVDLVIDVSQQNTHRIDVPPGHGGTRFLERFRQTLGGFSDDFKRLLGARRRVKPASSALKYASWPSEAM